MSNKVKNQIDFGAWATAVDAGTEEVKAAYGDLHRRGLVVANPGGVTVSLLAMRGATSDVQRRLAAHLSGYLLTENSYIVRRAGNPPSSPYILNTRIAVEYIANYLKDGWDVTDIEQDLNCLTREEIEAAIQYYLHHSEEIEWDIQRSRELYQAHST